MTPGATTSTVLGGKLSVVGSHASSIDVDRGTLGGSGRVDGDIDVGGGVLQPGLAPEEAAAITDVAVAPGNVLNAGGDVRIGRKGGVAATIRSDRDYTSVQAAGDVSLDGDLTLDVRGVLPRDAVLTIMSGRSVRGGFDRLPEGRVFHADGHLFRVSYRHDRVTLTVVFALPHAG